MKIVTTDYTQLIGIRDAISAHKKIEIDKITKSNFTQDLLDNKFLADLNSDKVITNEEYEIIWGWLAQGKPNNVAIFIQNASILPATSSIPTGFMNMNADSVYQVGNNTLEVSYEGCSYDVYYKYGDINQTGNGVDSDDTITAYNILLGDTAHPSQNSLEFILSNMNRSATFTGISFAELLKIDCVSQQKITADEHLVPATTEITSDWNMDGVVDELDLLILERYVLTQPRTLEEYNKDRGEYPLAKCLPDLNTGKYQCPTVHESCYTPTPTPIRTDYYMELTDVCLGSNDLIVNVRYNIETSMYLTLKVYSELNLEQTEIFTLPEGNGNVNHIFENIGYVPVDVRANAITKDDKFTPNLPGQPNIIRSFSDFTTDILSCQTPTPFFDCDKPHPDDFEINYGDYLIFKRWLELGRDYKLWRFNLNRDYAPLACRLPYNKYDDIGSSTSTFSEVYDGLENL